MKKSILTLIFLLTTLITLQAQIKPKNVNVKWGPEMKEPARSTITDIIAGDNGQIFTIRTKASGLFNVKYIIETYNESLKMTSVQDIELIHNGKELAYEFALYSNEKLYVFASFNNQKLKKNRLFAQELDTKNLNKKGKMTQIAETDSRSKANDGSFNYEVSKDKSKIAILASAAYEKKAPDKFNAVVLDEDIKILWKKSIKLPYPDELYNYEIFRVDNEGNFYVQGILFKDKAKAKRKGKPNYSYLIHSYRDQGETTNQYKIALKDRFITDLNFKINKRNEIVCAGFYSDKGTYTIKGTYLIRVNQETGEKEIAKTKEFGKDFLTEVLSDKQLRKGKQELYEYDLDKLILRDDGGAVLLAEQYYVRVSRSTRRSSNGAMTTDVRYYYYYNDIIVVNINPDGSIEWLTKVPKRQVTVDDGGYFSSFADMITGEKIYLIFNDNPKNLGIKDSRRVYAFNGRKSVVTLAAISQDGSYEKSLLFSNKDQAVITRPKVCEQISKDEMLLYGELRKKFRLANVSF